MSDKKIVLMSVNEQIGRMQGDRDDIYNQIDEIRVLLHELKEAIKEIGEWANEDESWFFPPSHDEDKYDISDVKEDVKRREEEKKLKLILTDELPLGKPVLRRR